MVVDDENADAGRVVLVWIRGPDRRDLFDRADERVEESRFELTPAQLDHRRDGVVGGDTWKLGPVAGEGFERIGNTRDACLERSFRVLQAARVAAAVPPFVVAQCNPRRDLQERGRRPREQLVADLGVTLHRDVFRGRKRSRFQQGGVGNTDLAHIVKGVGEP